MAKTERHEDKRPLHVRMVNATKLTLGQWGGYASVQASVALWAEEVEQINAEYETIMNDVLDAPDQCPKRLIEARAEIERLSEIISAFEQEYATSHIDVMRRASETDLMDEDNEIDRFETPHWDEESRGYLNRIRRLLSGSQFQAITSVSTSTLYGLNETDWRQIIEAIIIGSGTLKDRIMSVRDKLTGSFAAQLFEGLDKLSDEDWIRIAIEIEFEE